MIIIDDTLPDISNIELIKSFQRSLVNQKFSIVGCFSSENTANEARNYIDKVFLKSQLDEMTIKKHILPLLQLSQQNDKLYDKFTHKRMWRRINVDLSANISQSSQQEKPLIANAISAKILNISLGGAFISHVDKPQGLITNEKAIIILTVDSKSLPTWEALTKIVRLQSNDHYGFGLKFLNMTESNEEKIINLINQPVID